MLDIAETEIVGYFLDLDTGLHDEDGEARRELGGILELRGFGGFKECTRLDIVCGERWLSPYLPTQRVGL